MGIRRVTSSSPRSSPRSSTVGTWCPGPSCPLFLIWGGGHSLLTLRVWTHEQSLGKHMQSDLVAQEPSADTHVHTEVSGCQEMRMIGNNCKFHPRGFLPHSFTHKHRKQHLPPYERQVGVMDKTLIKEEKKGLSSHHTGGRPHIHLCDFIRISSWNMTGTKHVRCSQVAGNKKKMTTPPQIVRLRKARQAEKEDRSSKEKESMVKPKRLEFQVAGWAVPDAFTRKAKHASHGETSKKGIERCKYFGIVIVAVTLGSSCRGRALLLGQGSPSGACCPIIVVVVIFHGWAFIMGRSSKRDAGGWGVVLGRRGRWEGKLGGGVAAGKWGCGKRLESCGFGEMHGI
eukprot:1154769-Pelagomonas_calceolata.AAC.1